MAVFSFERFPSLSRNAACEAYRRHTAPEYVLLSNDRDFAVATDLRPEACTLVDYCVFPPNLAWTMAFTHEDGRLGPYFARHPDYERLNKANRAKLEKQRQAEAAKLKGWR